MRYFFTAIIISTLYFCTKPSEQKKIEEQQLIRDTINDGLIAYWPLNGNLNDSSGNGYNLTGSIYYYDKSNFTSDKEGKENRAFRLNYNPEFLSIPKMPKASMLDSLTISYWAKPVYLTFARMPAVILTFFPPSRSPYGPTGYENHIGFGNETDDPKKVTGHYFIGNCIQISPATWPTCYGEGYLPPLGDIAASSWIHMVWVKKGKQMTFYVNNVKTGKNLSNLDSSLNYSSGGRMGVTMLPNGRPTPVFNGVIDDVKIYGRALSDSEVEQLFKMQL